MVGAPRVIVAQAIPEVFVETRHLFFGGCISVWCQLFADGEGRAAIADFEQGSIARANGGRNVLGAVLDICRLLERKEFGDSTAVGRQSLVRHQ